MEFLAIVYVGYGIISVARWFWWRINAYTEIVATILGLLFGVVDLFTATFAEESFVLFGTPWAKLDFAIKIAVLDGVLYINGQTKMRKYLNDHPEHIIMSALVLREYLYQI